MPAPRLAVRPALRQAADPARLRGCRVVPGVGRGRHRPRRGGVTPAWWMVVAGTGERPYTEADRVRRPERHRFPRRPRIARGDMLVVYAAGSAREYGEGRVFAVEECVSDEPHVSGHERWKWEIETRRLTSVALPLAPTLRDIGVSTRSIGRHSHIRLTESQVALAAEAFSGGASCRP